MNNLENHVSPAIVRGLLTRYGLELKKSLGQNFLADDNMLELIANAAEISETDTVLDIGAGLGTLTGKIAARAGKVLAYELDHRLIEPLNERFAECENVEIVHGDFLKADLSGFGEHSVKVCANLPYYVTTPIIMKLLESGIAQTIVIMIQKEVAERMVAKPGTKDYGALTLAVQYRAAVSHVANVPPQLFIPPPKVESTIIKLQVFPSPKGDGTVEKPPKGGIDEVLLFTLIRAAFAMRRKTLVNNLCAVPALELTKEDAVRLLAKAGFDAGVRGEQLSLEDFKRIEAIIRAENGQ